jgi:hypothetical protein
VTHPTETQYSGDIYDAVERELQQHPLQPPKADPVPPANGISKVQQRIEDLLSRARADTKTLHQHLSTLRTELEVARTRINADLEFTIENARRKAQDDLAAIDAAYEKAAAPAKKLLEHYSRIMQS